MSTRWSCCRERFGVEGRSRPPDTLRLRGRQVIRAAELIQRKRDGEELNDEELADLVLGYARDEIPDYQLAAFCMAVASAAHGRETYALTDAMMRSGDTIDLQAEIGRPVADKHSTGGVGDKASLSSSARSSPPAACRSGR